MRFDEFTPRVGWHERGNTLDMRRTTITFTVSVPPEMMEELEEARKKEHRTRSELVREALRRYIGNRAE